MKKRKIMGLVAFVMALCLVWTTCLPGVRAATTPSATDKYDGDYSISTILSRFQYFVNNVDMPNNGHTVGAVAVGDTMDLGNNFGDAAIVPSYIKKVKKTNGISSKWIDDQCNIIYYGEGDVTHIGGQWQKNPDYMDVDAAFVLIQKESIGLASTKISTKLNLDSNGGITINCVGKTEVYVVIDYATFEKASYVDIKVDGVDWFKKNVCCISITGVNKTDVNLDVDNKIRLDGSNNGIRGKLKDMTVNGEKNSNDQYNREGMNLVWNFPDAEGTIKASAWSGHMVAPKATVHFTDNYEGGVIASTIAGTAQGHFYPMKGKLKSVDSEDSSTATTTEKGSTATTTEKKTTATTTEKGSTATTTEKKTTATTTEKKTTEKKTTEKKTTETSTEKPSTEVGGMEVQVRDEKTKEPVPNAKVEITYPDGRRDVCTTDENGTITKKGLTPGDYTVTVIEVPEGYDVTTGKEETVTVEAGKTAKHVIEIKTATAGAQTDNTQGTDTATASSQSVDASSSNAAKTGDSFPVAMLVLLLTGAAATILILGYSKRKYE